MNYQTLEIEKQDHITWIYFNRDQARNSFDDLMIKEFVEALKTEDANPDTRLMIISGRGKAFNAGGDIKAMQAKSGMFAGEANELRNRYIDGIQTIPIAMHALRTPVIAMVNGPAIGAGLDVACMCDIRIAGESAKFGETFSKLGLIPGDGGTFFLQRVVGFAKAMELTLTAEVIDSEEAKRIGLVSKVVRDDQLKEQTLELAKKILSNGPIALSMAKRAIIHSYQNDLASSLDLLAAYQGITQNTSDHFEALTSFRNKTGPTFLNK